MSDYPDSERLDYVASCIGGDAANLVSPLLTHTSEILTAEALIEQLKNNYTSATRRLPRPRDPAPFKATPIKPAPNLIINALSFKRQMGHEATEVGVISLYELDKLIDSKKAEKRAAEDPLYDDTEETRRLIREKLPPELQAWADVFSKAASDKLAPHRPT
ncbi:Gag/polymerase/env polyprotein [Colletotrichum sp. SAR11_240]|nr:Gag/polymerase/env polyprotein [Colletotrichum sp. SAR11_240]